MNLNRIAALLLLALPLAACASTGDPQAVTHAETADAAEASLPEVRYYMIADT
jgi:PBP1b-binding outer membrane lipoprotein LpoB